MNITATEGAQQARSKENTRRRLIEASIEVFTQKGVEGATVDDLTRAAGFTRGAFYSNFFLRKTRSFGRRSPRSPRGHSKRRNHSRMLTLRRARLILRWTKLIFSNRSSN